MPLQIQPGVIGDKMTLVYHTGAIKFPNDEVQLKAAHIDAVKVRCSTPVPAASAPILTYSQTGSRDLITIYVELPGQREDVEGLETKMLEHVAYLLHPYTFEVYQASGKEWAEYVGDVTRLFPTAARELEMAVRVRNENIENGGIHIYVSLTTLQLHRFGTPANNKQPEKPNCPGPRGQEYVLLNPVARHVRAELGKPSDEPLVLIFINTKTGQCVPEFYRAKVGLDFDDAATIKDINKWRCQVMSRKKCEPVRFDRAEDEMWTVKEQGRLNQVVRAVLEYHRRRGMDEDATFDRIDWDMVRMELESFCYEPQPGSSELAICCDKDLPKEGKAQRRKLRNERVTFCRTSELVKQRAIDTIATIMESEIDERLVENREKAGVFELQDMKKDGGEEEDDADAGDAEGDVEADVATSRRGKKVAAPITTNKVVSGRIIRAQTNGKKGRGKRAPKANGSGAAHLKNNEAPFAAAAAESSSSPASQSASDNVANPAAVKKAEGKGKGKGKGKEVVADADVMITSSPVAYDNHDAIDDDKDLASAIALSKLRSGATDGAGPSGDPSTPPAKPAGGPRRSARRQK